MKQKLRSIVVHFGLVGIGILIGYGVIALSTMVVAPAIFTSKNYTLHSDIPYGSLPRQSLDIYIPKKLQSPAPVILYFYGGAWQMGKKEENWFVAQGFASKGVITVIADYRLYPEVYFPDFLRDAAEALIWTHKHIASYGGDSNAVFLAGHSAGAYNAVMIALDPQYVTSLGGSTSWISGVIGLAGLYDYRTFFVPDNYKMFSRGEEKFKTPSLFWTEKAPPMLLMSGDRDMVVDVRNTTTLTQMLEKHHNVVHQRIYTGMDHMDIVRALKDDTAPLKDTARFIHEIK